MENRDLILHFKRVQKLVLGKASFCLIQGSSSDFISWTTFSYGH